MKRIPLKGFGTFNWKCYDEDKNIKWEDTSKNLVVNAGLTYLLNIIFKNGTRSDPLYVGLYTDVGGPQTTWTLSVGMTEFTSYSGNRKEFVDDAIVAHAVSNTSSPASFSITGGGTIYGGFIATVASGTAGTLYCASDFTSGSKLVSNGDTLTVTYTMDGSDDGA